MYFDFHSHRPTQNAVYNLDVFGQPPPSILFSAGIHPWWLHHQELDAMLVWLESLVDHPLCLAIGECGIDKSIATPMEIQSEIFQTQIQWAVERKQPLIIHCVRAYQECLRLLQPAEGQCPVIFHGFTGSAQLAQQIVGRGHCISLPPRKGQHRIWNALHQVPIEYLVLETDNSIEPIESVYNELAQVKNMPLIELISFMHSQALTIFGPQILLSHGS